MIRRLLGVLLLVLGGCRMDASTPREPRPHAASAPPPAPAATSAAVVVPPPAPPEGGPRVELSERVAWVDFETATARAKAERKSICLLVYAHWCPHCRNLAPAFSDPEVERLSGGLLMVRQNADERPAWLETKLAEHGDYVPRLFFIDPDGKVRTDLNSGNDRYPYFYTPGALPKLRDNMRLAAGS